MEVREASPGEPARNPHAGAPRTPRPAISIRGLTKRYGPLTALNDLNLDIQPGEVFGFLGLNGAGKPLQVENLLVLWAIAATGYALAYLVISQRDIAR